MMSDNFKSEMFDDLVRKLKSQLKPSHESRICLCSEKQWLELSGNIADLPVEYLNCVVRYHESYMHFHYSRFYFLPLLISQNGRPLGLWPLHLCVVNGFLRIGSNSGNILPPIFSEELTLKQIKNLTDNCFKFLVDLAKQLKIKSLVSESIFPRRNSDVWIRKFMSSGGSVNTSFELLNDLGINADEFRSQLRKGCRSAIKTSQGLWRAEVLESLNSEQLNQFRELHKEVSGRITRGDDSWLWHQVAVNRKDAFVIFLFDQGNRLIGAALFYHTKLWANYAVAAYKRNLFDKPVAHLVQDTAIDYMRKKGLKYYQLGTRSFIGEWTTPSEKESSIGRFKESFSTGMISKMTCRLSIID